MTVFLLDISHWQGANPDLARAKTEGIAGVIIKATQGGSFVDDRFAANLARARAAGMLTAAYHFLDDRYSVADNVRNVLRTVPAGVPIIPDAEYQHEGNTIVVRPSKTFTKDFIDQVKSAGRSVPLAYIPRWYWEGEWRSPSLAGFPPLWQSRYPDNTQGYYRAEWQEVVDHYPHFWDGFGSLPVTLLQFTSSGRVAGYGPLDVNAFRGTYAELVDLFGEEVALTTEDIQKIAKATATELLNRDVVPNLSGGDPDNKNVTVKWALALALGAARDAAKPDAPIDVKLLADELAPRLNAASARALADELSKRLAA